MGQSRAVIYKTSAAQSKGDLQKGAQAVAMIEDVDVTKNFGN
jgi:hypothetical protein